MTKSLVSGFKRNGKFIPTGNSGTSVIHSSDVDSNNLKRAKSLHIRLQLEKENHVDT